MHHVWPLITARMNVTVATNGLLNELLQLVDSWWRLLEHRCRIVSCLFVPLVHCFFSRRKCVLRCAYVLGCGAAPRDGIVCRAGVGCGVLLHHTCGR